MQDTNSTFHTIYHKCLGNNKWKKINSIWGMFHRSRTSDNMFDIFILLASPECLTDERRNYIEHHIVYLPFSTVSVLFLVSTEKSDQVLQILSVATKSISISCSTRWMTPIFQTLLSIFSAKRKRDGITY